MEPAKMEIAESLPLGARAPLAARRAVDCLGDLAPSSVRDMARLVVSELVTNIVQHSGLPHGEPIHVRVVLDSNTVRIEVADSGSHFEPRVRKPPPDSVYGRGLLVIDRVADRWGTIRGDAAGVWAELDLPADRDVA
jgi:two-component sensor histidine kinase